MFVDSCGCVNGGNMYMYIYMNAIINSYAEKFLTLQHIHILITFPFFHFIFPLKYS